MGLYRPYLQKSKILEDTQNSKILKTRTCSKLENSQDSKMFKTRKHSRLENSQDSKMLKTRKCSRLESAQGSNENIDANVKNSSGLWAKLDSGTTRALLSSCESDAVSLFRSPFFSYFASGGSLRFDGISSKSGMEKFLIEWAGPGISEDGRRWRKRRTRSFFGGWGIRAAHRERHRLAPRIFATRDRGVEKKVIQNGLPRC